VCEAFLSLSLVKLDNWNIFDGRHVPGHYKKNIGNFVKASHTLARTCVSNTWAKFRSNPINLDTPIIHLNWGNTRKNKTRGLGTERFRHFSHLIKAVVSVVMPPPNRTQHRNPIMSVLTKWFMKFVGKGKPEHNMYFFWTRFFNHNTKSPESWSLGLARERSVKASIIIIAQVKIFNASSD